MGKRQFSTLFTLLLSMVLFSQPAMGHQSGGYHNSLDPIGTSNTDWMKDVSGELKLSELSLPGTHDSMAFLFPFPPVDLWVRTQSMTLSQQLNAGIRVFDMRPHNFGDRFEMYHGPAPLFAEIGEFQDFFRVAEFGEDVLTPIRTFLAAHNQEVVFVAVAANTGGTGANFNEVFTDYMADYENDGGELWSPYTPDETTVDPDDFIGPENNPKLKDLRGKLVILQNFTGADANGNDWGITGPYESQNRWEIQTRDELYAKWDNGKSAAMQPTDDDERDIKHHLENADNSTTDKIYQNPLSANTGAPDCDPLVLEEGATLSEISNAIYNWAECFPDYFPVHPAFAASGHVPLYYNDWPREWTGKTDTSCPDCFPDYPRRDCLVVIPSFPFLAIEQCIDFEGTNVLAMDYINSGKVKNKVGIIWADYPGPGLIEAIIGLNTNDSNLTPTVDIPSFDLKPAEEGSTVTASATFGDPGDDESYSCTVDYGDGSGSQEGDVIVSDVKTCIGPEHVYADDDTYPVTVAVTDNNGATGTNTAPLPVVNVAPTVYAGPDRTVNEGALVSLPPATFSDPGTADTHTATIDWGDGTPLEAGVLTEPPGGTGGTVAGSHVYADNGTYTVDVCVEDDDGGKGCESFNVTVNNVAPTVTAGPDQMVNEGELVSLAPAAFTDPGSADTHTATIDWGDGTPLGAGVLSEPSGGTGGTVAGSHVYVDNGAYTVDVCVEDDDGGKGCDSLALTVNNVAPTATFANTTSPDIFQGESATLVFTNVFDPGTADTFAYSYDCTNDGSFEQSGDTTTFDCTYPDFGTFNARGRIEDDDGGFTDYAVEIIVLSPQEAAQTIIDKIEEDLCDAGVLNKGQCNSLVVKLKHAKKRLGGAKPKAAINVFNAFINEVNGYMNGGILTSEQGKELIDLANRIIASIG